MSNITAAASAGSRKPMTTPRHLTSEDVGRFYDDMWQDGFSPGGLAHGEAYIGQECLLSADEIVALARLAEINDTTLVLDIGSGTGGPACYLAEQLGCRVLGVDVSAVGHAHAVTRARAQGLSHLVEFRQGDIHALALPAASVDVILSLDAWWHMPQRAVLLQRCAEWLRPGGWLAFYDHVERHPLPEAERLQFYAQWRLPDIETPQSYLALLKATDLHIEFEVDTAFNAARFYTGLLEAYTTQRLSIEAGRGPQRYQAELARLRLTQPLAAFGMLGQIGCLARKPGDPSLI